MKAITILAVVIMTQGCAKPKSSTATAPGTGEAIVTVPGNTGSAAPTNSVVLVPTSKGAFEDYSQRTMSGLSNFSLTMNLFEVGDDKYAGDISISYTLDGKTFTDNQETRQKSLDASGRNCQATGNKADGAKYNKLFKIGDKDVWHGFFQDCTGSVVVVLDGFTEVSLGDGNTQKVYRGSVWYKNFSRPMFFNQQQGNLPCWEIEAGPYDCRTFLTQKVAGTYDPKFAAQYPSTIWEVNTTSALNPSWTWSTDVKKDYAKMATFTNLDFNTTFGK